MVFTKNDLCELKVHSVNDNNMSNWQITYTIDTLTTVNNKFDVLSKINDLINQGVSKRNIFVTDKSFLISTNYKTYFEKGDILKNTPNTIIKIASIGRMITMEYNEDIVKVNSLIAYYKRLNSIMNDNLGCRLKGQYLSESYAILFRGNLEMAYISLTQGAKQQIYDIFERHLSPDNKKMNGIIERIEIENNKQYKKNRHQFEKNAVESVKKFEHAFNRLDRPILGIYDEYKHSFKIINTDQMYKNGEESDKQIRLKSISKNSPVIITLLVTGTMLSFIGYLVFRDHKVTNEVVNNEMLDIPQDQKEVINNIFCNKNGIIFSEETNKNESRNHILDAQLMSVVEKNFSKLEYITNKKKVHLEIIDKTN